jgi:hypothetical protein
MTASSHRPQTKVSVALAISILCAFGSAGCTQGSSTRPVRVDLQAPDLKERPVQLAIPAGFLNQDAGWWEARHPAGSKRQGVPKQSLILQATWPELAPKSPANAERFDVRREATLHIFIETIPRYVGAPTTDPVEQMSSELQQIRTFASGGREAMNVAYPEMYGLRVEGVPATMIDMTYPDGVTKRAFRQVMVSNKGAAGSPVIHCAFDFASESSTAKQAGTPQCEHVFAMPELDALVNVKYSRRYLPQWEQVESRVRVLLTSFISHEER